MPNLLHKNLETRTQILPNQSQDGKWCYSYYGVYFAIGRFRLIHERHISRILLLLYLTVDYYLLSNTNHFGSTMYFIYRVPLYALILRVLEPYNGQKLKQDFRESLLQNTNETFHFPKPPLEYWLCNGTHRRSWHIWDSKLQRSLCNISW